MLSFIFLKICGDIPFAFVNSELVNYDVVKTFRQKSLFGTGINKGIWLLLVYYPVELVIQLISLVRVECLAGLLY